MIDHATELRRYAPLLGRPTMMLAAADEIERLAAKLEAAEKERDDVAQQLVQSEIGKREISEARDGLQAEVGKLKDIEVARCVKINGYIVDNARLAEEVERLQAKIEQMEKQEPVAIQHRVPSVDFRGECVGYSEWQDGKGLEHWPHRTLYALPGAKGEEK